MRILEEPMKVWGSIVINQIVKLLPSKESIINIVYNLILVIIDRFIKYVYFLLYIKESGIEEFAYWFQKNIIN